MLVVAGPPHVTTLSSLTYEDLRRSPAWRAIGDYTEEVDARLESLPAEEDVPAAVEEVWCLCRAVFADGSEHLATAMCRGDAAIGPLLCSVWNGVEDVAIIVPPAPPFVLEEQGPSAFCARFSKALAQVFPLTIEVLPTFETAPRRRAAVLLAEPG